MAFTVMQAGTDLHLVGSDGFVSTLTLPTGVTLRPDVPPRFTLYGRYVILANTPSQPLTIDSTGTVRLLCPAPPRVATVLSGTGVGTLSGTYASARYTFVTVDTLGNIISESDYSPASNSVAIVNNYLQAASLDISPDSVTGRRIYRPTTNGAILFQWVDLDGNVLTSIQDDLSDAGLALTAAPVLGTPPHLTHLAEFRGRLFGVGSDAIDTLRYTEAGIQYAWPADNTLSIPVVGSDSRGVTALVPRREALGVGRSNQLVQITGTGSEDSAGSVDLDVVILSRELGIESQESVVVYRDTAYFLWKDGVYSWNSDGFTCLSDGVQGRGNVRSWFTTDDYFERSRFKFAFGCIDTRRNKYRLHIASVDSTSEDRWVEFDLSDRTWWGPHKTDEFTPTSAFSVTDANDLVIPVIGSTDGDIYQEQDTRTDAELTPIEFDVITKRHDMQDPDTTKYFGLLSMFGKAQDDGDLTITTRAGELESTTAVAQSYDMTLNRERLARVGVGKHMELELTHSTAGEPVELYGYEVDPIHAIGKR